MYLHALRKADAFLPWTPAPAVYAALMIMGTWIFPFVTVYIPHNASGTTALSQTRLLLRMGGRHADPG